MPFSLAVYRLADRAFLLRHPLAASPDFDRWQAECDRRLLFEAPVGSDHHVYTFWSVPAAELGLPLLRDLYQRALEVAGEGPSTLGAEVDVLQRYWLETVEDEAVITYGICGRDSPCRSWSTWSGGPRTCLLASASLNE
jgi:hypothetical protein